MKRSSVSIWNLILVLLFDLLSCLEDKAVKRVSENLLHAQRYDQPGIYDSRGRYVLLRGVNLNTIGDYWQANPEIPAVAPYNPDHFRLMSQFGFNVVRLLFHWSALEPDRGQYSYDYIAQIRRAVEDAAIHGVYVLLDMHQDAFSKYIATPIDEYCEYPGKGWDGAPEWATITDGASTCTEAGRRESAPAVYNAWRNFWNNTDGIRDACIAAWQEVVKATADLDYVLGYDALNEPSLGNGDRINQLIKYNNFLRELLQGIRFAESEVGGYEHIFFFEPTVSWSGEQVPSIPAFDFSLDDNIVFAPHNYFEVIGPPVVTIEEGAALYDGLTNFYGTHCFVGEWGVFGNPVDGLSRLKRFAAAEDAYFMGSTWWQWCQAPGDPHGISWDGKRYSATSLHLLEVASDGSYTGLRNDLFLNVLSRNRPLATHGRPLQLESDPDTGALFLSANAPSAGVTDVWINSRYGQPQIDGVNSSLQKLTEVEGGYLAEVSVEGSYTISISY